MRMLLTSNGPRNGVVHDAMIDLLGRPTAETRIVVVIDAILPFGGDNSTLLEHLNGLHALGWAEFDILSLLGTPRHLAEERLRAADVILGYGGSNSWLAHAWTSTGLDDVLRELLETTVYVGWSAGSMIFSRAQAAAVGALGDGELRAFQIAGTAPAVPLFDWFVIGHLGADYLPHQTDAWAAETAAKLGVESWFLDDDTALVIRDPAAEPEVVSSGRWLRISPEPDQP